MVVEAMYGRTPPGKSIYYQQRNGNVLMRSLSVKKLAETSGVPVRSLNDFVSGKSNINSDTLGRILDTLCLSIIPTWEVDHLRKQISKLESEAAKVVDAAKVIEAAKKAAKEAAYWKAWHEEPIIEGESRASRMSRLRPPR